MKYLFVLDNIAGYIYFALFIQHAIRFMKDEYERKAKLSYEKNWREMQQATVFPF